jgi:hypothetical protein
LSRSSAKQVITSPAPWVVKRRILARAPALTAIEQRVYDICKAAAAEGRALETSDEIMARIGATGVATVPGILKRLESKGYIERTIYQRGRVVCIPETGQCTLPPANLAPHWRLRTDEVPSPAIQAVRDKSKPISAMIEAEARLLNRPISAFLADLAYIGWHQYQAEKERGE